MSVVIDIAKLTGSDFGKKGKRGKERICGKQTK